MQQADITEAGVEAPAQFRGHVLTPEVDVIALDEHRPLPHVLSSVLTIKVDADPETTRRALDQADLSGPALRALDELGLGDRVTLRPAGLSWTHDGRRGHVAADVTIQVDAAEDDSSWLSIRTRFSASDDDARVRLLDAWALVGPIASNLVERAARTVKALAEGDAFNGTVSIPAVQAA